MQPARVELRLLHYYNHLVYPHSITNTNEPPDERGFFFLSLSLLFYYFISKRMKTRIKSGKKEKIKSWIVKEFMLRDHREEEIAALVQC